MRGARGVHIGPAAGDGDPAMRDLEIVERRHRSRMDANDEVVERRALVEVVRRLPALPVLEIAQRRAERTQRIQQRRIHRYRQRARHLSLPQEGREHAQDLGLLEALARVADDHRPPPKRSRSRARLYTCPVGSGESGV
jgi:hypothetical protein